MRPAQLHERRALRRRLARSRRRTWFAGLGLPLAVAGGAFAGWMATAPQWLHLRVHLLIVAITATAVLVPLLALLVRERVRRTRQIGRDLNAGMVARFEGQLGSLEDLDRLQSRLMARELLEPDPRRVQRVEIFPGSGLIVRVNGRAQFPELHAPVFQVAVPRPHGYATALPGPLLSVDPQLGVEVLRRSLTPAELAELRRYGASFRRRFWISALLGALPAGLLAGWLVGIWANGPIIQGLAATLAVGLVAWLSYALWLRITRRIDGDCSLRWVITLRESPDQPSQMEILPSSRLVWTEAERPARWRLSPW